MQAGNWVVGEKPHRDIYPPDLDKAAVLNLKVREEEHDNLVNCTGYQVEDIQEAVSANNPEDIEVKGVEREVVGEHNRTDNQVQKAIEILASDELRALNGWGYGLNLILD
jgi:hypothetical protein